MAYPRELELDEETTIELSTHLDTELWRHFTERGPWLDDVIAMQHEYWAEPAEEQPEFPFQGCANIIVPLEAIAVEANHARVINTLYGLPQLVSAKSISPDWTEAETPLEMFLDKELKDYIRVRKPLNDMALEWEKFGTCVGKTGYLKEVRRAVRTTADGTEEEFEVVVKSGPCVDATPISRFLMPFANLDPQTAGWCGEEHSKTPHEIRIMEESGLFREGTYDKLKDWVVVTSMNNDDTRKFEESQENLEDREIVWPARINWFEIWLSFNVDGDTNGKTKEIVVHYHRDSKTFMSIRYNWDRKLRRPYDTEAFFPVENRWTGIGLCKMSRQFQAEATAKRRQLLDNATMANMRMIKVSRLSGYQPGEPVYPGKMWIVDDMTHVDSFQMGEVYPSAYNTEQSVNLDFQTRTGFSDLSAGLPQQGTPGTATSDLARVQEGSKKFGYTYSNFKSLFDRIIQRSVSNIRQFGPSSKRYYEHVEGGRIVEDFFRQDPDLIDEGLLVEIRSAGQLDNKLLDRQNWLQISPTYQQYATGMLQLLTQLHDPELVSSATQQLIAGGNEIMRQILESFDVRNIDRMLIKVPKNVPNTTVPTGTGATEATPSPSNGAGMGDITSILAKLQARSA